MSSHESETAELGLLQTRKVFSEKHTADSDTEYEYGKPLAHDAVLLVTVTVDTSKKRGHMQEKLYLMSDSSSVAELCVQADVVEYLRVTPPSLDIGVLYEGEGTTAEWEIDSPVCEALALSLGDLNQLPNGWVAKLTPVDPTKESSPWRLTLDVRGTATEVRKQVCPLLIKCSSWQGLLRNDLGEPPATFERVVNVIGEVVPTIHAVPEYLSLGMLEPTAAVTKKVQIRWNTSRIARPLEVDTAQLADVRGADALIKGAEVATARTSPDGWLELTLRIEKGGMLPPGPFKATLTVGFVGHGDTLLHIPVFGVVRTGS